MKFRVACTMLSFALLGPAVAVGAYEIGSQSKVKQTWDVHETITAIALECSNGGVVRPTNCITGWDPVDHPIRKRTLKSQDAKTGAIEDSSRWADDPTRQLDRTPSSAHWGAAMFTECKRILTDENFIDNVGLACSTHYGRLQFWHAMASTSNETTAQTRQKILAWAEFAYRTATDPTFRRSDYCDTVEGLREDNAVRQPLTFSNQVFCEDRKTGWGPFRKHYPAWRVATLFALSCRNPLTTRTGCRDLSVADDDRARTAAIGALLHLVQDSYSQAHVGRRNPSEPAVPGTGPFRNRIVCQPAERFYDYAEQLRAGPDVHSAADQPPVIDSSCLSQNRKVDDAVTASANVLWFTAQLDQDRSPEKFVNYLATKVFPGS